VLLSYPPQQIRPEGLDVTLGFQVSAGIDRRSRGFGFVTFTDAEAPESPLRLDVLLGVQAPDPQGIIILILLLAVHNQPHDTANLVLATVRPNPAGEPDCDIWDLLGPDIEGDPSALCQLRFDAMGEIRQAPQRKARRSRSPTRLSSVKSN